MSVQQIERILEHIALWAAIAYVFWSEARHVSQTVVPDKRDKQTNVAVRLSLLFGLALGWALSGVSATRWQSPAVYWLGIALMFGGQWFRNQAIGTLGRAFSVRVGVQEGQQLVQNGFYRYLRHPAYAGVIIWVAGVGLMFSNLLSLLVVVGPLLLFGYPFRILVEESVLLQAWGDAYREYMRRTYRLIPFVW